jgi:tRNA (guanine26-N2/guanine27-N2)-dimethyltransferase
MVFRFPVEEVTEGKAKILVPSLNRIESEPLDHTRSRAPVFYNPTMCLNRDLAVLITKIETSRLGRIIRVCEPMCGTGVRGVRLALEGEANVTMGDLNPSGIALTEENLRRNRIYTGVKVREMDANLLLNLHSNPTYRFNYVDIDPYGSPATYMDSAIRSTIDGGIIALTATDLAPLCGVNPNACLRKYGGRPLQSGYTHEIALRLMIGGFVRSAAIHELGVKPLLSYYVDHYVRSFMRISKGAKKADYSLSELGFVLHCQKCLHRIAQHGLAVRISNTCEKCGNKITVSGPMWLGDYSTQEICDNMKNLIENAPTIYDKRLEGLLSILRDEIGYPSTFFDVDEITRKLKLPSKSPSIIVEKLREAGFKANITHFKDRGIKTDATITDMLSVIRSAS